MAGTYTNIKVKLYFQKKNSEMISQYEGEFQTQWIAAKDKFTESYQIIANVLILWINQLRERDPHKGLRLDLPIPEITSLSWSISSRQGKYLKGGTYKDLKPGNPPVALMTPLPQSIDEALEKYHLARDPNYKRWEKPQPPQPKQISLFE